MIIFPRHAFLLLRMKRFQAMAKRHGLTLFLGLGLFLSGCTPHLIPPSHVDMTPQILEGHFRTADGLELPLRRWAPEQDVEAILIGLHGMNDHANAFRWMAPYWQKEGIFLYAYDQRGFGNAPYRGYWGGWEKMTKDAQDFARLVQMKHPQTPVFFLGLSMGGAVVLNALDQDPQQPALVDGAILVGPAVWGRDTIPFYQTAALWLAAHTVPSMTLTGRGLKVVPSDNYKMLKEMSKDPLILRETRVDALWGLVNLMDHALLASSRITTPLLLMYGLKDDIVPKTPTIKAIENLPLVEHGTQRVALYKDGYHMLLRDVLGVIPRADVIHWIKNPNSPLPSGADQLDWRSELASDQEIDYPTRDEIKERQAKASELSSTYGW